MSLHSKDIREQVKAIIARLIKARKAAGLTQGQAAQRLGVSPGSMSHYEGDYRGIDLPLLLKLCDIYDVSPAWVITGSNPDFDADVWYKRMESARDDLNRDLKKIAELLEMTAQQPD